jgi:two-component system sensor histidine kinase DesK
VTTRTDGAAVPQATSGTDAAGAASAEERSPWQKYGWVMAVVWMIFLVYPIVALVHSAAHLGWVVAGWIALVVFAVFYVVGFVRGMAGQVGGLTSPPHAVQWVTFGVLVACALISIPAAGGSALSFLPFIMSFASYGLTRTWHWITLITCVAVAAAAVLLIPGGLEYASVLVILVLLGVVNSVSTALIIRSDESERLARELATSAGRETVARDVHDLVGHSLTVVALKTQLAHRLIDTDPERAKAELADIERLTSEAIAGVRATVSGVRVATLTEQLASCRAALEAADVEVSLTGRPSLLSPAQALTASWILREATTNVLRHARARQVRVEIAPGSLAVVDDGVGVRTAADSATGNGLRGMRERAAAAGAVLAVDRREQGGTRVAVTW